MDEELTLNHEPAVKDNGEVYKPYFFDDTGQLQGFRGFVCRLCHSYYADPKCSPETSKPDHQGDTYVLTWPCGLSDQSVCPAKVMELLKQTIF